MGNPFQGEAATAVAEPEATTEVDEAADVAIVEPDLDVDSNAGADEAEDTVEATEAAKASSDKPAKVKKTSTRKPVAEGYITPVDAAKALSEHLTAKKRAAGELKENEQYVVAPQIVYATLNNNGPNSKNPIAQYTDPEVTGGRKCVLKKDEFLAWWDAKDARVANRKTNVKTVKADDDTADAKADAGAPPVEAE